MKEIKVYPEHSYIDIPITAIKKIPEWYKKTPAIALKGISSTEDQRTFKTCIPFMDAMTSGYIVELWADIEVKKINNEIQIFWRDGNMSPMGFKTDNSIGRMDVPVGYGNKVFSFNHNLYIKTPKDYSLLFTQPFNRFDLPFLALTGIVDTDVEPMFPGGYPLFLREGFEGVIEKGTPLLQITPIKRENWKISYSDKIKNEGKNAFWKAGLYLSGWYKKNAWVKKSYE